MTIGTHWHIIPLMITYDWNREKNQLLISTRGVSFEEVVVLLENGNILDVIEHPNQAQYSHQKMYILEIKDYVYLVPFVEEKNKIFLKTIIPSRKAKKEYHGNQER